MNVELLLNEFLPLNCGDFRCFQFTGQLSSQRIQDPPSGRHGGKAGEPRTLQSYSNQKETPEVP